ncbi:MAG: nucleoside deaminase [Candidatus Wildermuthbacteria bacterium]|nr:nucleoside deaminase [Candidatus Wildermuthbacteria bacterium]
MKHNKKDEQHMRRCIELAEQSVKNGDAPFGSLIARNRIILAESGNAIAVGGDVTNHAEILAMKAVQKALGTNDLSDCDIYSNCEPCPMCAFMMRELKFRRVVFAAKSPYMGGYSKWNILQDKELQMFKPVFGKPPRVIAGLFEKEAQKTFLRAGWSKRFFSGKT